MTIWQLGDITIWQLGDITWKSPNQGCQSSACWPSWTSPHCSSSAAHLCLGTSSSPNNDKDIEQGKGHYDEKISVPCIALWSFFIKNTERDTFHFHFLPIQKKIDLKVPVLRGHHWWRDQVSIPLPSIVSLKWWIQILMIIIWAKIM